MSTVIIALTPGAIYIATLTIGLFRMKTVAWNWAAVAIAAVAAAWTAATGSWIASGIWLFNIAIAANLVRMRLKYIRREAEYARLKAEYLRQLKTGFHL